MGVFLICWSFLFVCLFFNRDANTVELHWTCCSKLRVNTLKRYAIFVFSFFFFSNIDLFAFKYPISKVNSLRSTNNCFVLVTFRATISIFLFPYEILNHKYIIYGRTHSTIPPCNAKGLGKSCPVKRGPGIVGWQPAE